jgi:hypothetical protein
VADAVNDWLTKGLKGRDNNAVTTNRILAEQHFIPLIGAIKLKEELSANDVDQWLVPHQATFARSMMRRAFVAGVVVVPDDVVADHAGLLFVGGVVGAVLLTTDAAGCLAGNRPNWAGVL